MKHAATLLSIVVLVACGSSEEGPGAAHVGPAPASEATVSEGGGGHSHAEDSLGTVMLGELEVELAQGHGAVVAGKEAHLVVKLPYSDSGSTTVRAWIGTEDRLRSYVGKGEYAAAHDDYDVHATAPDPLPADVRWWIEIERPDGTKLVGSARPILE